MQGGYGKNNDFRPIPGFISELGRVIVTIVAGCPGTLNCGRPARVPGAATVVSFIEQGVVSAGRAGGFGLLLEAQPKMMRVMKYRVVRTY